jgi:1,3-beta-galactosyl-N-acetylhexosamine phosphorylase
MSEKNTGRVTIPTNLDVVPETIELMKRWGADAIRDCDGTEFPEELTKTGAKIYATIKRITSAKAVTNTEFNM